MADIPRPLSEFELFRQKVQAATDELLAAAEYYSWLAGPRLTLDEIDALRKSTRKGEVRGE